MLLAAKGVQQNDTVYRVRGRHKASETTHPATMAQLTLMTNLSSAVLAKLAPLLPPLAAHENAEDKLKTYDCSTSKPGWASAPSFNPLLGERNASRTAWNCVAQ